MHSVCFLETAWAAWEHLVLRGRKRWEGKTSLSGKEGSSKTSFPCFTVPALAARVCFAYTDRVTSQNSEKSVWRMHSSGHMNGWNNQLPTSAAQPYQGLFSLCCQRTVGICFAAWNSGGLASPPHPLCPASHQGLGDSVGVRLIRVHRRWRGKARRQARKRQILLILLFYWPSHSHMIWLGYSFPSSQVAKA